MTNHENDGDAQRDVAGPVAAGAAAAVAPALSATPARATAGPSLHQAADHLVEVIRQADLEATRRVAHAEREAASLLGSARDEAAALREHARREAQALLVAARARAASDLEVARAQAAQILSAATDQLHESFRPPSSDVSPAIGRAEDVKRLVWESARLAERMRSVNLEIAEYLSPPDAVSARAHGGAGPRSAATTPAGAPGEVWPVPGLTGAPTTPLPVRTRPRSTRPRNARDHRDSGTGRRGAWGFAVYRYRRAVIGLSIVVAIACAVFGPGVIGALSGGGFEAEGSPSQEAMAAIEGSVGRQTIDVVALYRSDSLTVDDPAFEAAVADVVAALPAQEIASANTFWTTGSPAFVSTDRRSTYLALQLTGDEADRAETYRGISDDLQLDRSVGTTALGGFVAIDEQLSEQVGKDLTRAETIAAPVLGLLLVIVFGSLVAAGLPLLIGGLTVIASFVLLRLMTQFTDVSVFAVNIVTVLGLGLSVDYALLVVSRFREELRAGHPTAEAVARTMTTAGRSVAISATTVAVSLAGLTFFPVGFLRSMAYGGVAAVAMAAIGSLTLLPAVLATLGAKVDALRMPLPKALTRFSARTAVPGADGADPSGGQPGSWERLARSVMRRPVIYTVGVSAVLLTMALPTLQVQFGGIDARQLPVGADSRVVQESLARDFAGLQVEPIDVLVRGASQAVTTELTATLQGLDGVTGVAVAGQRDDATLLAVTYTGESVDATARGLVEQIRRLDPPAGTSLVIGGASADQVDLRAAILDGLWKMALLTLGATFLVLFWAFGSVVLPLKAAFMNVLAVAASLGVVVLIFQDGYLSGLLNFTSTGSVEMTQPILVLAILFGVTTDYEVFLLSRIREEWDRTRDNTSSVALGLQRTGPIITSAAVLILVVIVAFSTSQVLFIKLIGVGMAVAILLDATIVRALLVPATMRLLGRWNWWSPGPVLRFWEQHRPPSEHLAADESLAGHGAPGRAAESFKPDPAGVVDLRDAPAAQHPTVSA